MEKALEYSLKVADDIFVHISASGFREGLLRVVRFDWRDGPEVRDELLSQAALTQTHWHIDRWLD